MKRLLALLLLLLPAACFGQGQDSIRASAGVLTISLVPSSSRYKVFVDQTITNTVFTNPIPAAVITVLFVQDATGHTVAFGGNISGGCTVASTATATTGCQFTFDSANNAWTAIGGGGGGGGIASGATLPATCSVGTVFFLTTQQGVNAPDLYKCTATNVFTPTGSGGIDPAFVGGALSSVAGAPQIFQIGYGQAAASQSNITATFPFATSQNHTYLVNVFQSSANTVSSVTTTQSDTCTQQGSTQTVASKNIQIFKCLNVVGGASTTITANFSGAGTFNTISIMELAPSDVDIMANATGTSTSPSSGNIVTTNTQDTLIGYIDFFTTSACTTANFPPCNIPGSGYLEVMGQDGNSGSNPNIFLESQVVNNTGTYVANGTLHASATWEAFGIAMKGTPVTPVVSNSSGAGPFSLGTITSLLTPVQFKISGGQITAGQGQLTLTVTSGSITNAAWVLEASIDGGTSWTSVPCQTRTQSNVVAGEQIPIYSTQCSLQGLMGETGTNFRFGPYQGYGISNLTVWGAI